MNAMEMMLKTMGVDPAALKKQVEEAGANFEKVVKGINGRLDLIDTKLNLLLEANQIKIPEPTYQPQIEDKTNGQ